MFYFFHYKIWSYIHWNLCICNNLFMCTSTYWIAFLTKPLLFVRWGCHDLPKSRLIVCIYMRGFLMMKVDLRAACIYLRATSHTSHDLWPWNCESPKESVKRSSQDHGGCTYTWLMYTRARPPPHLVVVEGFLPLLNIFYPISSWIYIGWYFSSTLSLYINSRAV